MSIKDNDSKFMDYALELARNCRGVSYYGVGCVIVGANGDVLSSGYTGEQSDEIDCLPVCKHAEEIAIEKARLSNTELKGATLYSTLEPCSERRSGLKPCVEYIIEAGIAAVVYGAREPFNPQLNIDCRGHEILEKAGILVRELYSYNERCLESIVSWRK